MSARGIDKAIERLRGMEMLRSGSKCSDEEIRKLEAHAKVRLPNAYRTFLSMFGHDAHRLWIGSDARYEQLGGFREVADEIAKEDGVELKPADFVFLMHQGYTFVYFTADGINDDPPVFQHIEGEGVHKKVSESFSEFVLLSIDEIAK